MCCLIRRSWPAPRPGSSADSRREPKKPARRWHWTPIIRFRYFNLAEKTHLPRPPRRGSHGLSTSVHAEHRHPRSFFMHGIRSRSWKPIRRRCSGIAALAQQRAGRDNWVWDWICDQDGNVLVYSGAPRRGPQKVPQAIELARQGRRLDGAAQHEAGAAGTARASLATCPKRSKSRRPCCPFPTVVRRSMRLVSFWRWSANQHVLKPSRMTSRRVSRKIRL